MADATTPEHTPPAPPNPEQRKPAYTRSPAEAAQVRAWTGRVRDRAPAPKVKVKHAPPKPAEIGPDHPDHAVWDAAMHAAFGTTETAFAERLTGQLLDAVRPDRTAPLDERTANALLAAMHGIAPRDETEALLAAQMVATHDAAMALLGRAVRAEYRHTLQDSGSLAVKLLRTYAMQVEALSRYRGKGQQKIVVERVTVNRGGQAIVGHVEAGAGRGEGVATKAED